MQYFFKQHPLLAFVPRHYLLAGAILFLLVACGPAAQEPAVEEPAPVDAVAVEESPATEGYPAPVILPTVVDAYPVSTPAPEAYPPAAADAFQEPRFRFDLPIQAGSTSVAGQAPPGMVLAILDVTYNGALLGVGPSDDQGRFEINVSDLIEGNRIGITFGELEPGLTFADMSIKYFPHRGDGFMNLPNVGIVLDSAIVEP